MIEVTKSDESTFVVVVSDDAGETRHLVAAPHQMLERLAPGYPSEALIGSGIPVSADREPKEAIFRQFDLMTIGSYFAEFENELPRYLAR